MKKIIYLFVAFALLNFVSCSKSGTSPSKQKGGTTATAMYPASMTLINGNTSQTYQYTYDSDNNLTKYGTPGLYEIAITPHIVTQSSFGTANDVINTYAYAGPSNAPVDIYTSVPSQLTITTSNRDIAADKTTSYGSGFWLYTPSKDDKILQMGSSDNGGQTINYAYDTNGNLKSISYINLSGPQAGKVISTVTVTAVDNKPSPFSAIKGYNVISYPQYYAPEIGFAFCKNNPTQIILTQFDYDTGTLVPDEQDDFTYTYNAQGYPTQVNVSISYLGIGASHGSKTYNFTYK